jgi:glycosyltransferase involved in cell wall biosynthesis
LKRKIYLNGKFSVAKLTGVQRVGWELKDRLVREFDRRGVDCIFLAPSPKAATSRFRALLAGLWEQCSLPLLAGSAPIVNLCNTAPLFAFRRQFVLVHDAAVYDMPINYSRKYRLVARAILNIIRLRRDMLGTVSAFSRSRICAALNVPESRISIYHNGGNHAARIGRDDTVIDRLGLSTKPYILAVGSLQPGKNFKNLLLAMEKISTDVILVIVGGGDSVVFGTGVALPNDCYVQAGYVSDQELHALYANAVAFVQASTYEGFGLPVLEAMVYGAPVICSTAASLPEVCGDAAVYFDPLSPAQIAEKIDLVVGDEDLRSRMKQMGKMRARNFDWDATACDIADDICTRMLGLNSHPKEECK